MQIIKHPVEEGNQFGTVDILPDKMPVGPVPVGIFLCGIGSLGNGSSSSLNLLINGEIPQGIKDSADKYGMIWICPQTGGSYSFGEVDFALSAAVNRYNEDALRFYLWGFSLGGGATFTYVMKSESNARKFAAVVPMATTWPVGDVHNIANAGLPVWASHNSGDNPTGSTPPNATISTINAINALNPTVKA